jgi:hypothetical protein
MFRIIRHNYPAQIRFAHCIYPKQSTFNKKILDLNLHTLELPHRIFDQHDTYVPISHLTSFNADHNVKKGFEIQFNVTDQVSKINYIHDIVTNHETNTMILSVCPPYNRVLGEYHANMLVEGMPNFIYYGITGMLVCAVFFLFMCMLMKEIFG